MLISDFIIFTLLLIVITKNTGLRAT